MPELQFKDDSCIKCRHHKQYSASTISNRDRPCHAWAPHEWQAVLPADPHLKDIAEQAAGEAAPRLHRAVAAAVAALAAPVQVLLKEGCQAAELVNQCLQTTARCVDDLTSSRHVHESVMAAHLTLNKVAS